MSRCRPVFTGSTGEAVEDTTMTVRAVLFATAAALLTVSPASAQFYKDKTLTLLVNYGAGGNADTEARVYQRHLSKYIPGHPTVIIRNVAGAGGSTAMNQLGLGIGSTDRKSTRLNSSHLS